MSHMDIITGTACDLARELEATAIVIVTETGDGYESLIKHKPKIPVIAATVKDSLHQELLKKAMISTISIELIDEVEEKKRQEIKEKIVQTYAIKLNTRGDTVSSTIEDALIHSINKGLIHEDDIIIALGSTISTEANSIFYYHIKKEKLDFGLYQFLKQVDIKEDVFETVLNIALEIGREGREGRLIGTGFIIGNAETVMNHSKQLILNPFRGHMIGERTITNPEIKESIKELAQLDGAFVINKDGIIEAAGRYINIDTTGVEIPRGLGSRHAAVAAITAKSSAIGVTVSQSGGIVRVFKDGKVILTIEPQKRISFKSRGKISL